MKVWIKRIAIAVCLMLIVGGIGSWWLARQARHVPEFYTRASERLPAETVAASRQMQADVKQLQEDVARPGAWRAELSDDVINAWLVEEFPRKFPRLLEHGASDPRIAIEDGQMLAAVRYRQRKVDTVISCEIRVAMTEQPNMLALEVEGLKAGALPLPLSRFLKGISKEAAKGNLSVQWDLSDDGPIALVTVPSEDPRYKISPVTVESVQLLDGRLVLTGHTGPLAAESFRPQGPVHKFVSFRGENRQRHSPKLSAKPVSTGSLR